MAASKPVAPGISAATAVGRYRWRICALCFLATTINYVDRQVLGVIAPYLQQHVFFWTEIDYSNLVNAFQAAYAIGLLVAGGFIDRVGTRIGYAVAMAIWSLATMGTALAHTVSSFGIARFFLGVGESGNFPASIKTVAEWFPNSERAFATGIFNSGANIGAMVAPIVIPWLTVHYGWQSAFLVTGSLSVLWIIPWIMMYRKPRSHPRLTPEELNYIQSGIQSDPPETQARIAWARLLAHRQTWAFVIGKFMTDPIWWFVMFWLPKFLNQRYHLTLTELGWPLVIVYNFATVGSIAGGWLSARFLKHGWTVNRARKTAMLACALCVTPMMFAATASRLWAAVTVIGLATAAHQGWSANLFTLASDLFPKRAVGSVVGIGGFGGAVGGMAIATFTGFVLEITHSYVPMFLIAGTVYLLALLIIHLLVPRMEPAVIEA